MREYKNEIFVIISIVFLVFAIYYNKKQETNYLNTKKASLEKVKSIQEVVLLKKIWSNSKTTKEIDKIKRIQKAKKWKKKGKKISINYINISSNNVNKIVTKFLNIGVSIDKLKISQNAKNYNMEIICSW